MYCMFNQLGRYEIKDMNVYIEPLIDELMELWNVFTLYDISRPVGTQGNFNSIHCSYGQSTMPQG